MKTRRENDDRRFFGNGNWSDPDRRHRGWQVICVHCGRQSKPVVTSHNKPVPPETIAHRFARQGWLIGKYADEDACPQCLEKTRTETLKQNQVRERNIERVKQLRAMIPRLDRFLTDNVAMYSTPEFLADHGDLIQAFGSLLDTAFLCNLMPPKWKEQPVPYSRGAHLQTIWDAATEEERVAFVCDVQMPPLPNIGAPVSTPESVPTPPARALPEAAEEWAATWVTNFRGHLNELGRTVLIRAMVGTMTDEERLSLKLNVPELSEPPPSDRREALKTLGDALTVLAADPGWGDDDDAISAPPAAATAAAPEPLAKPKNISPKMAELRDRARRQLNGTHNG